MSGRILLVEDDVAVATLYERTLTSQGFEVHVASTGTEGLAQVRAAQFDAIVSDIAMPEMDGVQLLEKVRELDPLVPVLFLTGSAQVETVRRAIELRAFRYLIKPVNLRALVASVRRAASCCRWVRARERAALVAKGDPTLGLPALDLEARFEEALSLMRVYFQPVLELSTRELRGFRSVARSPHPAFPSFRELRRAADKLGRREQLRRKLWEMTTAPLAALSDSLLLLIWTDVSGLSDAVTHEALRARAQQIVLMVSDRVGISDGASEHESLARLRAAGFRLGVDQLGEGYAGLSALAWLEPEFLELDAALVRRVGREPEQLRVVSALSALAKELGATLIAENVVDERDAQALADVGCSLLSWGALATPDELAPFSAEAISELRVLPGPSVTTP